MDKLHRYDPLVHPICHLCGEVCKPHSRWLGHNCKKKVAVECAKEPTIVVQSLNPPKDYPPLPPDFYDEKGKSSPSSSTLLKKLIKEHNDKENESLLEYQECVDELLVTATRNKIAEWKETNKAECSTASREVPEITLDEIDTSQLDLVKGTYRDQSVSTRVLKLDSLNLKMIKEFEREVSLLRKVDHENVVKVIGACTKGSDLCIITEFVPVGSSFHFMHKGEGVFELKLLLKAAFAIAKGMKYMHGKSCIHGDLKASNVMMHSEDKNQDFKIVGFGEQILQLQEKVMTKDTETYHWIAPETAEPYDKKADDVFAFGFVLWELLTRELPFDCAKQLQVHGRLPLIPKSTHPKVSELIENCWEEDPILRPEFPEIVGILRRMLREVRVNQVLGLK